MAATLEVVAHWDGGYRCHLPVRQFEIVVDEPASAGGGDSGPMPTEVFLASLASCFTLSLYHAARKRSIELPDLSVKVTGRYKGLRFEHITVEATSSLPSEQLQALIEPAIRTCYVSQTLKEQPEIAYVVSSGPDDRTGETGTADTGISVTPGIPPPPS
jgi:putative redox protein